MQTRNPKIILAALRLSNKERASRGWKIPLTQSTSKCEVVSFQAMKAYMGSRGLVPFFRNLPSKVALSGQFHAPAALNLGTNSRPN
jgi:hypothetical protein